MMKLKRNRARAIVAWILKNNNFDTFNTNETDREVLHIAVRMLNKQTVDTYTLQYDNIIRKN